MKAKLKKESFKWENLFGKQPLCMRCGWSHQTQVKWKGPYIVEEAHQTGHYWLKDQAGTKAYSPISGAHLKKYYD